MNCPALLRRLALCAFYVAAAAPFALPSAVNAAEPPAPNAHLTFSEGASGATADGLVRATLMGGATRAPGLVNAYVLALTGAPGGCAEIAQPLVDTTRSFTVMAWVKLNRIGGFQTFVSIDGSRVSGFFLQLRDDTSSFAFTMPPISGTGDGGAIVNADDFAPEVGVWYHVAGVYNATTHHLGLYINGGPQGVADIGKTWKADGPTAIGRGRFNGNPVDWTNGEIDDVRLYQAALTGADIKAIAEANLPASEKVPPAPANLLVETAQSGVPVSPMLYGLMTEEISHAFDGGLYAELIRNRNLMDSGTRPEHWAVDASDSDAGAIAVDVTTPANSALPHSLSLHIKRASASAPVGVANDGYWGIPVRPKTTYQASFFAQALDGFTGPLTVRLQSADGKMRFAEAKVSQLNGAWKRYKLTLRTGRDVTPSLGNRLVILGEHPGTVRLSLISLMPPTYHDRPNGTRIDLMQKQAAMKPAFLRMPGGNYLEGDTIATRFDWKKTIGPIEYRAGHEGPWTYRSTDGMGLLEMLDWCDDLHMEPVLAVYAGYSLNHYRNPNPQRVEPGPALQPFVQDALDEIEFLTGGPSTKWGGERVKLGHPAPFALHYVEIGNEDGFDDSGSYNARYAQFYDAIKGRYPKLQLISTAGGPDPVGVRQKVTIRTPDVIDEHYYLAPRVFESRAHQYDSYSRTGPKVFVGEWASQSGQPTPDMSSALGDAAWMTGMERNSDVVVLQSYAPLLVNVNPGARQWGVNLIGYDALNSYGSPSYWAAVMFGNHVGKVTVPAKLTGGLRLFESVTRDPATGKMYLKLVNASGLTQGILITLDGVDTVAPDGSAVILSAAHAHETNSITDPRHILPHTNAVHGLGKQFGFGLPAYSITVLELNAR